MTLRLRRRASFCSGCQACVASGLMIPSNQLSDSLLQPVGNQMELLDQPATLVLLGVIFLFGGLGVLKLLRPPSIDNEDESASTTESASEQHDEVHSP